jgi:hypothetical protein
MQTSIMTLERKMAKYWISVLLFLASLAQCVVANDLEMEAWRTFAETGAGKRRTG